MTYQMHGSAKTLAGSTVTARLRKVGPTRHALLQAVTTKDARECAAYIRRQWKAMTGEQVYLACARLVHEKGWDKKADTRQSVTLVLAALKAAK